ncbi:peptidase S41 [Pyxidicoccus fallax]|uniref:Peptidase S41 n=1 Tax=Pyxidicoccus fallax TaxID=394095 RepID=A0A848LI60_9BACT|nr:S41 family peptidase [Pyxidicoccus fallax]NMO17399.1 peptidase S41 [Pyxidicoccus fallax]NPC77902.1 peptidase S41 [Pyxidicoccus fallax]
MPQPHRVIHRSRLTFTTLCLGLLASGGAWAQSSPLAEDWCLRAAGGPAGTQPAPIALSAAHSHVRFFGTGPTNIEADLALANALQGTTADWDAAVLAYAAALEPACAVDVQTSPLPQAQVHSVGPLAYVRPGTGNLTLPRNTRGVIIDLRDLPAAPGLEEALARAIGAASTAPVERVPGYVRRHLGVTDEALATSPIYQNTLAPNRRPAHAATGTAELPVALLTGPTLAPAAARFTVDLRIAQRAWIVGEPVATGVAESRWMPVGARGLVVRTEHLEDAQGLLPDVLPADLPLTLPVSDMGALVQRVRELAAQGRPAPVDRALPALRPRIVVRAPYHEPTPPRESNTGIARADLLITHGAMRLFFPYFHVVGDHIDERLLETLASVDAQQPISDRNHLLRLLMRFMEVLKDGHGFGANGINPAGYFAVALEQVAGEVVIRRSLVPGVNPGDTVVSVAGRPITEWLAEEKSRTSAATPGYLHNLAVAKLLELRGPTVFGLRSVEGAVRTVEVLPQSRTALRQVGAVASRRVAGSLADLGAPELHYINLSDEVIASPQAFRDALAGASGASGLVVDMRGYPGTIDPYEPAMRLIPHTSYSPLYRIPERIGPDHFSLQETLLTLPPLSNPSYGGPVVLLVGPRSASRAEVVATTLAAAGRVTVVGRQTAGTNGDIARLFLPGVVTMSFTGLEVLFPDRSRFHGVGVLPDIEAAPTAADIAEGRDTELLRAIQFLQTGQ